MSEADLGGLAEEQFCHLTTKGRVSGKPHEIEIWFGMHGATIYMLAGGRRRSDWVRNIERDPAVTVRIGKREFLGRGRVLAKGDEDKLARRLLLEKYEPTYDGDLTGWGRTALPVAVDLAA